jgi:hypothetical protein
MLDVLGTKRLLNLRSRKCLLNRHNMMPLRRRLDRSSNRWVNKIRPFSIVSRHVPAVSLLVGRRHRRMEINTFYKLFVGFLTERAYSMTGRLKQYRLNSPLVFSFHITVFPELSAVSEKQ